MSKNVISHFGAERRVFRIKSFFPFRLFIYLSENRWSGSQSTDVYLASSKWIFDWRIEKLGLFPRIPLLSINRFVEHSAARSDVSDKLHNIEEPISVIGHEWTRNWNLSCIILTHFTSMLPLACSCWYEIPEIDAFQCTYSSMLHEHERSACSKWNIRNRNYVTIQRFNDVYPVPCARCDFEGDWEFEKWRGKMPSENNLKLHSSLCSVAQSARIIIIILYNDSICMKHGVAGAGRGGVWGENINNGMNWMW